MNVRYVVSSEIESTDMALLDAIESQLPAEDDVTLGNEFAKTREAVEESDAERLSARMTFATEDELRDTEVDVTPKQAAVALFEEVTSADLANKADNWSVTVYRSPEGGVLSSEVREWYEQNPDEQPVNEDGESYVPNRWNPNNHIEKEESQ